MKKRAILLSAWALAFIAAGLCYYAWCSVTGLGVPCIFYKITGLMCPGCGVSRLCMALIRLDFYGAFKANSAIFCLIPLWTIVFGVQAVRYVRYGSKKLKGWQDLILYFSAVVLVAYGVIRNIIML